MANVEQFSPMCEANLLSDDYFSSFVMEAERCGAIDEEFVNKIKIQCIELLAAKCDAFTGGASSSVKFEIGEMIMKSIFFTCGLYLKSFNDVNSALESLKSIKVFKLFIEGRKLIEYKIKAVRKIYALTIRNRIKTDNYSYNSTILHGGISSFFKVYNAEYRAYDVPASIDYQVCLPPKKLLGIEYMQDYLGKLFCENEFCKYFDEIQIHRVLLGYNEDESDLLINIFEIIYTQAIGCVLANKDEKKLNLTSENISALQEKLLNLSREQIINEVLNAYKKIVADFEINDNSLLRYMQKSLSKILQNLSLNLRTKTLNRLFSEPISIAVKKDIEFSDSAKMDDDRYSQIVDEIIDCNDITEKIEIIREKIQSFKDFEDLLFDCEFEEIELYQVISALSEVELATLVKNHPFEATDLYEDEDEKMLCRCIEKKLNFMDSDEKNRVLNMSKRIKD